MNSIPGLDAGQRAILGRLYFNETANGRDGYTTWGQATFVYGLAFVERRGYVPLYDRAADARAYRFLKKVAHRCEPRQWVMNDKWRQLIEQKKISVREIAWDEKYYASEDKE